MSEEGSRGFKKKRGDSSYSGTVAPPVAAAPGGVLGRRELQKGGKRREKMKKREKDLLKNELNRPLALI